MWNRECTPAPRQTGRADFPHPAFYECIIIDNETFGFRYGDWIETEG
jgi:hypothetical protein